MEEKEPAFLLLATVGTQKVAFVNKVQKEPQLQVEGEDRPETTPGTLKMVQIIICPMSDSTSLI